MSIFSFSTDFVGSMTAVSYFEGSSDKAPAAIRESLAALTEMCRTGPLHVYASSNATERPSQEWRRHPEVATGWIFKADTAELQSLGPIWQANGIVDVSVSCCSEEDTELWSLSMSSTDPRVDKFREFSLVSHLKLSLFKNTPSGRFGTLQLADRLVQLFSRAGDLYYGLVDIAPDQETGSGSLYDLHNITCGPRSLRRDIERHIWNSTGEHKRTSVRSICWGNCLGRAVLDRLGGRDEFLKRYRAVARKNVLYWQDLATELEGGGAYVKISRYPTDEDDGSVGIENAVWLYREFRRAGVLI